MLLDMGTDVFETGGVCLVQNVLVDQPLIDHPLEMAVYGGDADCHAKLPEMVMDVAGRDMLSLRRFQKGKQRLAVSGLV